MAVVIVRYGELALKSHSIRRFFTDKLISNIQNAMMRDRVEGMVEEERGRIYVNTSDRKALRTLSRVFGVVSVSWAEETDADMDRIAKLAVDIFGCPEGTFAVRATRTGNHDFTSQELAAYVGEKILDNCPDMKVNLGKPENELHIEVRNARAFVFSEKVRAVGGMPIGTQGDVMAPLRDERDLLAAWMMLKRGCRVHLHDIDDELLPVAEYWGASEKRAKRYLAAVTGHDDECLSGGTGEIPLFCPLIGLEENEVEERLSLIFS